jgi:hypothetical protein
MYVGTYMKKFAKQTKIQSREIERALHSKTVANVK